MNFIRHNFLALLFCLLLGAGLVYGVLNNPNAGAEKLRDANIAACQRGLAKSIILEDFMNQAAAARRSSAASEFTAKAFADYKNDIVAAQHYEQDAIKYAALTPTDCQAQYPVP